MLKTSTVTRIYYQTEDEDGNFYDEFEFFASSAEYNSYMKLTESKNEDDIVTQYTYNEFGETISEKTFPASASAMNILTSRTYENGNLASTSEKRYESTYTRMYEYDSDNNLSAEISPNGQYIYHTYTADKEKVAKISATVDGGANENNMTYNGDLVDTLTHNNTVVDFDYDNRNSISNVKIAGVSILSQETLYISNGSKQVIITYGNGAKIKKYYDKYNRLIRVTDVTSTETDICAYIYSDVDITDDTIVDPNAPTLQISSGSKLRAFVDNIAGTRTKYLYDEFGEAKERQVGNVREYINTRDRFNRPTMKVFDDGTERFEKSIHYLNDYSDMIASESTEVSRTSYIRDALNRLTSVNTTQSGNGYTKQFSYIPRGAVPSPEGTTNYINSISYYSVINNTPTFEKSENIEYNTDGHIVTYGENTYVYDRIGRLVRENNKSLDKTFLFCYNVGGNIVSKTEYAYTVGEVGTAIKTYNYTYGNAWKDQLTAFDGSAIAYDNGGNPTSYLGKTLTWSKGRLLAKYINGYTTIGNQYDANGLRRAKTKTNTTPGVIGDIVSTSYFYSTDGKLVKESTQGYTRYFFYTQDGIVGYIENGEKLLYRKNLFGDITAIYKGTQKVAEYTYDAWGNCTVTLDTNGYGTRNPFRYRGYYWDSDLNMYYLMTRYYDPKIGRFINADAIEYLKPESINGLNLYAYCKNNPIKYVDPTGHEPLSQDEISDWLSGLVIILWAIVTALILDSSSDTSNSKLSEIWENNQFALDLDWDWLLPTDSLGPVVKTDTLSLINFPATIGQLTLWFDTNKTQSLYVNLLNVSVLAGFDIDSDTYGLFVKVGVGNFGYDGRYINIELTGVGAGLGFGWENGKLMAGYDPIGYWGLEASVDFGQMISDILQ